MNLRATAFAILALSLALASPARATTCSVPNSFSNGTIASANQVNANFSALAGCANNLDWSNIGAGFWASNIVPSTVAQATFGGSQTYRFPSAIIADGDIMSGGNFLASTGSNVYLGPNASTTKAFVVDTTGNATVAGGLTVNGTGFFTDNVSATSFTGTFNGSGSGLANGSVPNSALATPALTGLSAGTGVSVGGGTVPAVGLSHGDYVSLSPGSQQSGSINVSGGVKPGSGSVLHAIAWGSCSSAQNSSCSATLSAPMADTSYTCTSSVRGSTSSQVVSTWWAVNTASVVTLGISNSGGGPYAVSAICVE